VVVPHAASRDAVESLFRVDINTILLCFVGLTWERQAIVTVGTCNYANIEISCMARYGIWGIAWYGGEFTLFSFFLKGFFFLPSFLL